MTPIARSADLCGRWFVWTTGCSASILISSSSWPARDRREDLLPPLRDRSGDDVGRRDVRARGPASPRPRRHGDRDPARAPQALSGRRAELDDPPAAHRARASLAGRAVRDGPGDQARVGRTAVRPAPRALAALRRARDADCPPALSARRADRGAPPPSLSEPAQPLHRGPG